MNTTDQPMVVLPELLASMTAASAHRIADSGRRRRRSRRVTLLTGGLLAASAAGAIAGGFHVRPTPEQMAAQRSVASEVAVLLGDLPKVNRADLSNDQQAIYDQLVASDGVAVTGHALGGDEHQVVFTAEDGQACVIGDGGASCMAPEHLSPHFDFGYDARTDRASISVIALGDVTSIVATTTDGVRHSLTMPSGARTFSVPGELSQLEWIAGGQPFTQRVEPGIANPDR